MAIRPVRVRRALAAGAVVPLLLTGLAACGDDEATSGDAARPADSSSAGAEDPVAESPTVQPSGDPVDVDEFADTLAAGYDSLTTAEVAVNLNGPTELTSSGVVDYRGENPAMKVTVDGALGAGGTSEVILLDQVLYIGMGGTEGDYMQIDLSDPDSPLADLVGMSSMDPVAMFQAFTDNIESVYRVGAEDIDGTATTHYTVVADTDAFSGQLGSAETKLPKKLAYDMWLDEQDRPLRVEADLGSQGSMRTELSDFGTDVTVKAPPASRVKKLPGA